MSELLKNILFDVGVVLIVISGFGFLFTKIGYRWFGDFKDRDPLLFALGAILGAVMMSFIMNFKQ